MFHENTFLDLELASPHFASSAASENFDVVVMKHLVDATLSFAIDQFPNMAEEAIETFLIEQIERYRQQ